MTTPKFDRDAALERMSALLLRDGYDGVSLTRLSEAAGVRRATLYHHFPDGKEAIGRAVLDRLRMQVHRDLLECLRFSDEPRATLESWSRSLLRFYDGGERACLVGELVHAGGATLFAEELRRLCGLWLDRIADLLIEAGFPPREARLRAEDAVIRLQGALVLGRWLGSTAPFRRTLESMPRDLLSVGH